MTESASNMASRKPHVPPELFSIVCSHLSKKDLQSARLVSKAFELVASPFLFRTVWFSTDPRDWGNIRNISQHPVFHKYVREIVYDNTVYESAFCKRETYVASLGTSCLQNSTAHCNYRNGEFNADLPRVKYSKAAVCRGHEVYAANSQREAQLEVFSGDHMMRRTRTSVPNELLTAIQTRDVNKLAQFLPADLVCLVDALMRMSRVDTFSLSNERWVQSDHYWIDVDDPTDPTSKIRKSFSMRPARRGWEKVVLDPGPVVAREDVYKAPPRGFNILTHAASISQMDSLRFFNVRPHLNQRGRTCLDLLAFRMSSVELQHAHLAFRGLTDIDFRFPGHGIVNPQSLLGEVYEFNQIASTLHTAANLTSLRLGFSGLTRVDDLSKIFGQTAWPRLRRLSLRYMELRASQLTQLLLRHTSSLQYVRLTSLVLNREPASDVPSIPNHYRTMLWSQFYQNISTLDLGELSLIGLWRLQTDVGTTTWHSKDCAEVRRFLQSGGNAVYAQHGEGSVKAKHQESLHGQGGL